MKSSIKIISLLVLITFSCCKKESNIHQRNLSLEEARQQLPLYYNFIINLQDRDYEFWDFKTFWNADKNKLPEKLIVIRHDIHHRDISSAYAAQIIEEELIGNQKATYFVMYNNPEEADKKDYQKDYLSLINYLKQKNIDTQPHISPTDYYYLNYNPEWKHKTSDQLQKIFDDNYEITDIYEEKGINIITKKEDYFNLSQMNKVFKDYLINYNNTWKENTGLTVTHYAAHGSPLPINKVLKNIRILNQKELLTTGVYHFDVYNTTIREKLKYLSDNASPDWLQSPELITDGQYQLLMHPKVWKTE